MKIEIEVDQEVDKADKVFLVKTAMKEICSSIRQECLEPYTWSQNSGHLILEGEIRGKWEIRNT